MMGTTDVNLVRLTNKWI